MKGIIPRYKTLLLFAALVAVLFSNAQVYVLDRNFGQCGSATPQLDPQGQAELKNMKVLSGNGILSAGNFFHDGSDSISILLIRYTSNGVMDTTFGDRGVFLSRISLRSFLNDFTQQPDGRFLIAGHTNNSLSPANDIPAVYRVTANGTMDPSFAGTGVVAMRFDAVSSGSFYKVLYTADDRIVAAGISVKNAGTGVNGIGLLKLKSNGETDSLFGNRPGFPGRSLLEMDSVARLHLFSMNNQWVLPFLRKNNSFDSICIARLLADGSIDASFGTNGVLNTGLRSETLSAVLQSDGKLLMGGNGNEPGQEKRIELLRYTSALTPDPLFGTGGHVTVPPVGGPGMNNTLTEITQLADGKILILGEQAPFTSPGNLRPFVLRLLENGELDSTMNGTGHMLINSEFSFGWNTIDSTDTTNFLVSRNPSFELRKYVPNTTVFSNTVTTDFDFTVEKLVVYFSDRSINGRYYNWDFGDGQFSDQVNPTHTYAQPGTYMVSLNVGGACDGQTITKRVDVRGIHKLTPDIGPDRGFTLCHIEGYGFDAGSQVVLKKDTAAITATTVFFDTATGNLQANFHFIGAATGLYDLLVTTGGHSDTLPHGFEIQPTEIGKAWVQIVGPYNQYFRSLTGERVNTYRLEYGVTGNATQYMVPIALLVGGNELTTEMLSTIGNRGDTASIPASMRPGPSGFFRKYDEITMDSVWEFLAIDEVVEANATHSLEFTITSTTLVGSVSIRAYIGNSLFDQAQMDTIYSQRTSTGFCDNACISCLFGLAGFVPGPIGCFASIVQSGCSVIKLMNTPSLGQLLSMVISFASTGVTCGTMTGTTFAELLKIVETSLFGIILQQPGGAIEDCAEALVNALAGGSCSGPSGTSSATFPRRGSFDPNIKTGPAGYNSRHYISRKEPLVYITEFENLSTATAPAYQVIVTDTLDKSVVDVSSFRFERVNIANTDYPVYSTKKGFAMDIPMPAKGIIVRVTGKIDTASGIVTWRFESLDTLTMQLVVDQNQGFLPPNTDSISGKAHVSFSVAQQPGNTHGTTISNMAKIVFDFNAPILTPVYTNIVDTVKPQSQVLSQFRVLSDTSFSIKWTGSDADAGIRDYKIYVSQNGGPYKALGVYSRDSTVVRATRGVMYRFVSIATDSVSNKEEPPADPLNNPDAQYLFNGALPVKLLSFTVDRENETALLRWSTASEINSDHFIVEHSPDGSLFSGLGKVKTTGTINSPAHYSFRHREPVAGYNYYRLKIMDRDDRFEYSPVRRIKFDRVSPLAISPNPAGSRLYITTREPGGLLQIISVTGKRMQEIALTGNYTQADISGLAPGLYIIQYKTPGNITWTEKLVVQRE